MSPAAEAGRIRQNLNAYVSDVDRCHRCGKAVESGAFRAEIAPITITEKAGPRVIANDEHP